MKKFIMFCTILVSLFSFTSPVYAKDNNDKPEKETNNGETQSVVQTNLSNGWYMPDNDKELSDILELKFQEMESLTKFINTQKTFVSARIDGHRISYFWNAPSLSASMQNEITGMVQPSGYMISTGSDVQHSSNFVKLPQRDKAKNAMQMFGFNIPTPAYMGEKPKVQINVGGVIVPNKPTGWISKIGSFFQGKVNSLDNYKDQLKSLIYLSPRDYEPSKDEFNSWLGNNYEMITDPKSSHYIKPNQVINIDATGKDKKGNPTGKIPGKSFVWVMDNLIYQNKDFKGLTNKDHNKIYNLLKEESGEEFPSVVQGIVMASRIKNNIKLERVMPYDLSTMSRESKNMFGGVNDPRSTSQSSLIGTPFIYVKKFFTAVPLRISGTLASWCVAINRLGSFTLTDQLGLTPKRFWNKTIMRLMIFFLEMLIIYRIILVVIKTIKDMKYGHKPLQLRSLLGIIGSILAVSCLSFYIFKPVYTYNIVEHFGNKLLDVSNVVLSANPNIDALYGDKPSDTDKQDVAMWLPYFAMWSKYQTGYDIGDKQQIYDPKANLPEQLGYTMIDINGKQQTLWSTILAYQFTNNNQPIDGSVYRVVDHFLAPRITTEIVDKKTGKENDQGTIKIKDISQNENFNNKFQNDIDLTYIVSQLILLFIVIIKVILFLEFIFNILLIMYYILAASLTRGGVKQELLRIPYSFINVMIIQSIATLIIYMITAFGGMTQLIAALILLVATMKWIQYIIRSRTLFKPRSLAYLQKKLHNFANMFKDTGNLTQNTIDKAAEERINDEEE